MSINTRVSLGVAFLCKALSATSSVKYIIHAEFIVKSHQYLLTKIKYTHNANLTLNVRSSETFCTDVSDVLQRLSNKVARKIEVGYRFDASAMQSMEETDETWGDFKLSGAASDPLLDAEETPREILATVMQAYSAQQRTGRNNLIVQTRNRKTAPLVASRIRLDFDRKKNFEQRVRMR